MEYLPFHQTIDRQKLHATNQRDKEHIERLDDTRKDLTDSLETLKDHGLIYQ
jgi:hypothetical protein